MSAYFVVELEITNSAAMEPYRAAVGATITQYGGRFLARAGATELIEGGPEPKRTCVTPGLTRNWNWSCIPKGRQLSTPFASGAGRRSVSISGGR